MPELPLNVVQCVEQYAARRLLVSSGAARLLQVVLQGAGNVGVDHKTHVRLVYTHAEGVSGDDYSQLTTDEALLDVLLGLRRQSRMEVVRLDSLCLQELRQLFGLPSCRAVDDGAARLIHR